ncbi:MAG: STAS domain-containing protein [Candidatus Omnitrophica bacterium]|nr:STAS domain-containing protein [Candidatus Omnitrophota bacterium]
MGKFIVTEQDQDVVIIHFSFNEINLEQREALKKELNDLMPSGGKKFVLDLSKVGFLSSLVLATIVFFAKEARKNNGEVKLSCLSGEALSIVQLTQLDKIFETYPTNQEAIASF